MTVGYLLDTSVISALVPGRPPVPSGLAGWLLQQSDLLFIPATAIAEIEQGIAKLHRAGAVARASSLEAWLDSLLVSYADRILPFDAQSARIAGRKSEAALAAGNHPGFADITIAAIALRHDLTVLTSNRRHFSVLGVSVADPFEALPHLSP
ncbi:type II toxin-antitoxin system VapC family toxin [Oleomonas cavernae]|uniref:Ribonuclease VapC n=1 Tax=Oleomonas cavernae TaxID=2320859 RepID=A0A418WB40_9PROT|nr:type II toxin-antitoxin system VapC family toxin [Oleomonas cavernae]RJF87220.1 type II toxin-antitoxin system VapC family toxin [Oleomonas cavernae]